MTALYEQEQTSLKTQVASMKSELEEWSKDKERVDKFIELVHRYTRFNELCNNMINEFVDKIIIHESVWSEKNEHDSRKGTRSQKVEVYLKYIGNFDVPDMRSAEEIEAERIAEEKREKIRKQKREYNRRKKAEKLNKGAAVST